MTRRKTWLGWLVYMMWLQTASSTAMLLYIVSKPHHWSKAATVQSAVAIIVIWAPVMACVNSKISEAEGWVTHK